MQSICFVASDAQQEIPFREADDFCGDGELTDPPIASGNGSHNRAAAGVLRQTAAEVGFLEDLQLRLGATDDIPALVPQNLQKAVIHINEPPVVQAAQREHRRACMEYARKQ